MEIDVTEDVHAIADYLRLCIQGERRTLRSIEDELGMGAGYLGQLLRGAVDLKLKHLLSILVVLQIDPVSFFTGVYGEPFEQEPFARARDPEPRRSRRRQGEAAAGVYDEQLAAILLDALRKVGAMALPEEPHEPVPRLPRKRKR